MLFRAEHSSKNCYSSHNLLQSQFSQMRMLRGNLENIPFSTGNLWFYVLNLVKIRLETAGNSIKYDLNFKSDLKHVYNIHLGEF